MIFLIEYNKPEGRIVLFQTYDASERTKAHDARLELELDLNRKGITEHEIVLLEANDEAALRKTHRRYFETISEIGKSMSKD